MRKFFKTFNMHDEYEAFIKSTEYVLPNVSWCRENNKKVHYNPYVTGYLKFVALEDTTFSFNYSTQGESMFYSLDDGYSWNQLLPNTSTSTVASGNSIIWKGILTPTSTGIGRFSSTGNFTAENNVNSILYGDEFLGKLNLSGKEKAFYGLFSGCTKLISAENLSLPSTILENGCYVSMFDGCTSLTTAPGLPAIALATSAYTKMFQNCTSLTEAPELPATVLAENCYQSMFKHCTGLTDMPELPAMILSNNCYNSMFEECTSLTGTTILSATTLANSCYMYMFFGCTSLVTAPQILASTTAQYCCQSMFANCTSLTTAPILRASSVQTLAYGDMFNGCSSLSNITCLATTLVSNCTYGWVEGVAANGTFTKASSMESWTIGSNGIPDGWTVVNA